jgi:serine protease Do
MSSRRILFPLLAATALLLFTAVQVSAALPEFVDLARELKPAVVNISTSKTVKSQRPGLPFKGPGSEYFDDFFNRFFQGRPDAPRHATSLGSGFIIDHEGHILTNAHVVEGADEITVTLSDERTLKATVIGSDSKLDLALLHIDGEGELPAVRLGNSDTLQIGEWVLAIGNPFGLEQTVTAGIVSAKGRVIGAGPYDDFIQTDASINPGNSGGPLFNTKGEVVGINTAIIARGQGIGFAIPINVAHDVLEQLKKTGHVTRGWLGVSIQVLTEDLAASYGLNETDGALITSVFDDSPAAAAGLKRGDIILAFDDTPIRHVRDLPRLVAGTQVGEKTTVTVLRSGKKREISVTIGQMEADETPVAAAGGGSGSTYGLTVTQITPELADRENLNEKQGLLITEIDPGSPAASANLRGGDILLEVNDIPVKTPADLRKAFKSAKAGSAVRLLIRRGEEGLYTAFRISGKE